MSTIYDTFDFGYDPSVAESRDPSGAEPDRVAFNRDGEPELPAAGRLPDHAELLCLVVGLWGCNILGGAIELHFADNIEPTGEPRLHLCQGGDSKQRPDRVLQGLTDYERPQLSGRQQGNAIASSGAELRKLLQELDRLPKRLDDFTRLSELCHSWLWLDDRHRP